MATILDIQNTVPSIQRPRINANFSALNAELAEKAVASAVTASLAGKSDTAHTHTFASLTSRPTTLSGFGIADGITLDAANAAYQPTHANLATLAAATLAVFGVSILAAADAAAVRTLIGAGTSSFDGAYASLSGIPSTFAPSAHSHGIADTTGLQSALDLKAPLASPTFTGTVSGVTKAHVGLSAVENTALSTWAGTANVTTLGTIAAGVWNGTAVAGQYGGTGVNNSGKTITLGGNLTTSGAFATTLTATATTSVTLPTTGTLATLAGSETLTNKTLTAPVLGGTITGTYTLGGTPTFPSSVVQLTTTQTLTNKTLTTPVIDGGATFTKTGFGAGISNAFAFTITGSALAADYPFGIRIDLTNNGTATPDAGRHGAALLGNSQDVAGSKTPLIGVEGKVQGFGTACGAYTGVVGDALFTGSTFAGTLAAFSVSRGNITTNGSTALNEGTNVGYYCYELLGGARKFGVLSREEIAGWGTNVRAYASDLTKYYGFYHDGTNGLLSTNSGGMIFDSGPSSYVLMGSNELSLAPLVTGSSLGIASNRWTASLASGSFIGLASSVTPANNGDLMFQATSNTSLTFKYKGSDGTVRSSSLTLA